MKKRISLTAAFCLVALISKAQTPMPFYDALKLKEWATQNITDVLDEDQIDTLASICKKYLPEKDINDTDAIATIDKLVLNNPFLRAYFKHDQLRAAQGEGKPWNISLLSAASYVGGVPVTNFADGLAKFLVKRFKEELTVTFFEKFKSEIAKSQEMQTLFPQSYMVLLTINTDIYQVSSYLNTLREGFIKDLTNLYVNFKHFSRLEKYRPYFEQHPGLQTTVQTAFYLIDQYAIGMHPGEVLAQYDTSMLIFKDDAVQYNARSLLSTVQAISASFRSISPEHYWVPADSLYYLLENSVSRDLYFGLMYQAYGRIAFLNSHSNTIRLDTLLAGVWSIDHSMRAYTNYIRSFALHTNEVRQYLLELKMKQKTEIDYNDYYQLYNSALDLIDQSMDLLDLPLIDSVVGGALKEKISNQISRLSYMAHSAGNLYLDISAKNYSAAVLNAANMVDTLIASYHNASYTDSLADRMAFLKASFEKDVQGRQKRSAKRIVSDFTSNPALTYDSLIKRLDEQNIAGSARTYIDSFINTAILLKQSGGERKLARTVLKYGTFAASIAQAENSDQVESAIESVALPSGSARIKREAFRNVSLNAYLGGFGGWEYLPALKQHKTSFSAGLSAPVGIAYSFGRIGKGNKNLKGGQSLTIFAPVIDVGALAAFRFGDDSSNVASTVELKNIVAPGLFVYYGFRRCPISIGGGLQVGPRLRDISVKNPEDINMDKNFYLRYGITIAVDIPILNFYTRTQ